jgi:glycosyltransferase involved in cell wall biosynthesis
VSGEENSLVPAGVVMVADSPCEDWPSMNAYAAALKRGFHADLTDGQITFVQPPDSSSVGRSRRRWLAASHRYFWLPSRLRSSGAPIVHILDQSYAHLIPGLVDKRVVVTCHDLIPLSEPTRSIGAWLYRRNIRHIEKALRVIAISDSTRTALVDRLGIARERIEVLPHGIDNAFFSNRWAGAMDPLRILHVGSNANYKRVGLAIDAAISTAADGVSVEFWKVGATLQFDQRDQLGRAGVALKEFGWVPNDALPGIYKEASVLLYPSSDEGQGKPVIEAMAVGLPVIASRIPAFQEVGAGHVTLVAGEDPTDYAAAVQNLRNDDATRADLSERGTAAARKYRWDSHVSRLREIYAEVAAS